MLALYVSLLLAPIRYELIAVVPSSSPLFRWVKIKPQTADTATAKHSSKLFPMPDGKWHTGALPPEAFWSATRTPYPSLSLHSSRSKVTKKYI